MFIYNNNKMYIDNNNKEDVYLFIIIKKMFIYLFIIIKRCLFIDNNNKEAVFLVRLDSGHQQGEHPEDDQPLRRGPEHPGTDQQAV